MSKGSAPTPSSTNTIVQQSSPPPAFLNAYTNLIGQAQGVAGQPFPGTYPGQLVAGFTPDQMQAFQTTQNVQGQFVPYLNTAGQAFTQATQPLWPSLPQYDTSGLPQAGISSIGNAEQYAAGAAQPIAQTVAPYAGLAASASQNIPGAVSPLTGMAAGYAQTVPGSVAPYTGFAGQTAAGLGSQIAPFTTSATQAAASAPSSLPQFFSPYTQQVTTALQNLFNQQNAQQQAQVAGSTVGAGAYGGDRQAVAQALTAQQQQLAEAQVLAQTLQQGFQAAQQQAAQQAQLEAQIGLGAGQLTGQMGVAAGQLGLGAGQLTTQAGLGAGQLGLGAGQLTGQMGLGAGQLADVTGQNIAQALAQSGQLGLGAGQLMPGAMGTQGQLGLGAGQLNLAAGQGLMQDFAQQQQAQLQAEQANAWLASQAGFGFAGLGTQQQQLGLSGAGAEMQAGGLQQQLAQEQLNIPYEQWVQQQAYPYQQLGFLAPIVEGAGSLGGGTSSTTSPGPSLVSQLGGLGIAGTGLIGATGGFGSQGWLTNLFGGAAPGLDFSGGAVPLSAAALDAAGSAAAIPPALDATSAALLAAGAPFGFARGGRIGFQSGGDVGLGAQPLALGHDLPKVPILSLDYIRAPGPAIKGEGPPKPPSPGQVPQQPSDAQNILQDIQAYKGLKGLGIFGDSGDPGTATDGGAYQLGGGIGLGSETLDRMSMGQRHPHTMGGQGLGHFGSGIPHTSMTHLGMGPHLRLQAGGESDLYGATSPMAADPNTQNLYQRYQNMSLEQLQELAMRVGPDSPYGKLVQRALMAKHMSPGSGLGAAPAETPTNFLPLQPQSGGTAQAMQEGGGASRERNYVTEDELDPHPVVDHSGDTIKIRYPSEGKVLDLGLPTSFRSYARGGRVRMQIGGMLPGQFGLATPATAPASTQPPTVAPTGPGSGLGVENKGTTADLTPSQLSNLYAQYGTLSPTNQATYNSVVSSNQGVYNTADPANKLDLINLLNQYESLPAAQRTTYDAAVTANPSVYNNAGSAGLQNKLGLESAISKTVPQPPSYGIGSAPANPFAGISPVQMPNVGSAKIPQPMTYQNLSMAPLNPAVYQRNLPVVDMTPGTFPIPGGGGTLEGDQATASASRPQPAASASPASISSSGSSGGGNGSGGGASGSVSSGGSGQTQNGLPLITDGSQIAQLASGTQFQLSGDPNTYVTTGGGGYVQVARGGRIRRQEGGAATDLPPLSDQDMARLQAAGVSQGTIDTLRAHGAEDQQTDTPTSESARAEASIPPPSDQPPTLPSEPPKAEIAPPYRPASTWDKPLDQTNQVTVTGRPLADGDRVVSPPQPSSGAKPIPNWGGASPSSQGPSPGYSPATIKSDGLGVPPQHEDPYATYAKALADLLKQREPDTGQRTLASPWLPMMAAGFGMMASRSPYPGVAIGEGGLHGIRTLEEQQALIPKTDLERSHALMARAQMLQIPMGFETMRALEQGGGPGLNTVPTGAQPGSAVAPLTQAAPADTGPLATKIASVAPQYGIPASLALGTAGIESSMGTDPKARNIFELNKRNWSDMGGGDPDNKDLQIDHGLKYLADMQKKATIFLGHDPENWQTYLFHQQGEGGAPALLRAPQGQNVVDTLAPAYNGNRTIASAAVTGNGGNANMSAQDFVNFQRHRFERFEAPYLRQATTSQSPDVRLAQAGQPTVSLSPEEQRIEAITQEQIRQSTILRNRATALGNPQQAAVYQSEINRLITGSPSYKSAVESAQERQKYHVLRGPGSALVSPQGGIPAQSPQAVNVIDNDPKSPTYGQTYQTFAYPAISGQAPSAVGPGQSTSGVGSVPHPMGGPPGQSGPSVGPAAPGQIYTTKLGPQAEERARKRTEEEETQRQKVITDASNSEIMQSTFENMSRDAGHFYTGPGAQMAQQVKSYLRLINPEYSESVASYEDFIKNSGAVTRQTVREVSSRAAVQEYNMINSTLPNPTMSPLGLSRVMNELMGINDYRIVKAQAQKQWEDEHNGAVSGFETDWQAKVTPTAFIVARMTPDVRQQMVAGLQKTNAGQNMLNHLQQQMHYIKENGLDQAIQ